MSDDEPIAGGTGETGAALRRYRRAPNDPSVDADRLESGRAWSELCRSIEAAGRHIVESRSFESALARAQGFEYLSGLVVSALRIAHQLDDPDVPRFLRSPDSASRWGAENADNLYLWARIRSDAVYRLSGRRRTAFDFLVEVKEGYMQLGDDRNFATLTSRELAVGADGRFEITLGGEPREGNWLPLHPDARYVSIRQYLYDWAREDVAEFAIERIGGEGVAPAPLTPACEARRLDAAAEWVEASARVWDQWMAELRASYEPGVIPPARRFVGGADDILYGNAYWRIEPGEAWIVETELPRARYWSFVLGGPWFTTLDYANHQTSVNGAQAHVDADGRVRLVIAHDDPGVPNWLDTTGHREGLLQYRWIWTETNPRPVLRVVKASAVRDALPRDTPVVGREERRRGIRERQLHLARREPTC
jgi:hypothetical protein